MVETGQKTPAPTADFSERRTRISASAHSLGVGSPSLARPGDARTNTVPSTSPTAASERWAHEVSVDDLTVVDTSALQELGRLTQRRAALDDGVAEAVRRARTANRTWSEIGAMLGESKQAAQRKYGKRSTAA